MFLLQMWFDLGVTALMLQNFLIVPDKKALLDTESSLEFSKNHSVVKLLQNTVSAVCMLNF